MRRWWPYLLLALAGAFIVALGLEALEREWAEKRYEGYSG